MYHPIYPTHKRPLVVRTGVDYRFTTIAVDLVDAVDGRYEVLFLGTGNSLLTALQIPLQGALSFIYNYILVNKGLRLLINPKL